MRALPSLTAVVIIAAAAASACGQRAASSGTMAGSPSAAAVSRAACQRPAAGASAAAGRTVLVTGSDNGKSLCVRPGTGVMVVLRGSPGRRWAPVHASTGALVPRPNGRLALVVGATGAYFVAAHPGSAVISSARPGCGTATASASPSPRAGGMECGMAQAFHATIVIRR